jgi:hypothetical protein
MFVVPSERAASTELSTVSTTVKKINKNLNFFLADNLSSEAGGDPATQRPL